LYIFWEHGIRVGIFSSITGVGTFVSGFVWFSPGIIPWWLHWFPRRLTPFLNHFRWDFHGGESIIGTPSSLEQKIIAFFEGIRFHWVSFIGLITSWCHWPKSWTDKKNKKISICMTGLFLLLFGIHFWWAFVRGSNPFGFSLHLSFFEILGILVLVASLSDWSCQKRVLPWLTLGFVLFTYVGMSYSAAGPRTIPGKMISWILLLPIHSGDGGGMTSRSLKVWESLDMKYGWDYKSIIQAGSFMLFCFSIIIFFLLVIWQRKNVSDFLDEYLGVCISGGNLPSVFLVLFLFISVFFMPFELFGGGQHNWECSFGVISSYEKAGRLISNYIHQGDKVYWEGRGTQSIFLELGDIDIFPQQMNMKYSYRRGGDSEKLAKRGLWNETLKRRWVKQADVLLIEEEYLSGWIGEYIYQSEESSFDEISSTSPIGCRKKDNIWIFRRVP